MTAWVGFDLDDTLHDFRASTDRAHRAVIEHLGQRFGLEGQMLEKAHGEVVSMVLAPSALFAQGMTDTDSRRARFQHALKLLGVGDDGVIPFLLEIYARVLEDSLTLMPGANELLTDLKERGCSISLISGGPEKTRRMIVDKLGLAPMIDLIVSSGGAGLSKTDGLFGFALGEMGVRAADFPYIGDSLDQDFHPALAVGIPAVWLRTEHASADDKAPDGVPAVSRLADALPHLIAG